MMLTESSSVMHGQVFPPWNQRSASGSKRYETQECMFWVSFVFLFLATVPSFAILVDIVSYTLCTSVYNAQAKCSFGSFPSCDGSALVPLALH